MLPENRTQCLIFFIQWHIEAAVVKQDDRCISFKCLMIQIPQCFLHKAVQIERYESRLLQVEVIECIKEVEEE